MIFSMTGFSSRYIELPINDQETLSITINLKATNGRFFEVSCKAPHALAQLEQDVIKLCKKKLRRGSIQCSIYCSSQSVLKGNITTSYSAIQRYLHAIDHIQKTFNIPGSVTIQNLITLPHVFDATEQPLEQTVRSQLLSCADEAIEELLKERAKEGAHLESDLHKRLATIHEHLAALEERAQSSWNERKERLTSAIQSLSPAEPDTVHDHHTQMIYSQLDKIDIHEEIIRFKSHLENFMHSMNDSQTIEKGKKLDFILQELFREMNTITAKCADSQLSERAINIKVELEKSREQVQNIV